jgi:hypothetical protein
LRDARHDLSAAAARAPLRSIHHRRRGGRDIDLSGRTAIVTGAASNLGRETVWVLASQGARVVVPAGDPDAARRALAALPGVEVAATDLLDPSSVRAFADAFLAGKVPLDLLILSAGVMTTPLFRDADEHEDQFAANHLGHFPSHRRPLARAARRRARPCRRPLLARAPARRHGSRRPRLPRPPLRQVARLRPVEDRVHPFRRRPRPARGRCRGAGPAVHPGSILGPLARHLTRDEIAAFGALDADGAPVVDPGRDMKTPAEGAATAVWCAIAPVLDGIGGVYREDCDIATVEPEASFGVRPWAVDPATAGALWTASARATGAHLPGEG